jgi:hypothetical protein
LRNPRTKEKGWLPPLDLELLLPPAPVGLEGEADDLLVLAGETLAEEGEAPLPEGKGGKTVSRCGCEKV